MQRHGAFVLNAAQIEALTRKAFTIYDKRRPHKGKDLIGKDPAVLAAYFGKRAS
jgi:hypothetical protein